MNIVGMIYIAVGCLLGAYSAGAIIAEAKKINGLSSKFYIRLVFFGVLFVAIWPLALLYQKGADSIGVIKVAWKEPVRTRTPESEKREDELSEAK